MLCVIYMDYSVLTSRFLRISRLAIKVLPVFWTFSMTWEAWWWSRWSRPHWGWRSLWGAPWCRRWGQAGPPGWPWYLSRSYRRWPCPGRSGLTAEGHILFLQLGRQCFSVRKILQCKGLEIQHLIGIAVAGFNHARTITKASEKGLEARQDD